MAGPHKQFRQFNGANVRPSRTLPATLLGCAAATALIVGVAAARSARTGSLPLIELAIIESASAPPSSPEVAAVIAPAQQHESSEVRAPINPVLELAPADVIPDTAMRWYNGRPIRPAAVQPMIVTAYSPDARSCGDSADGITASGYSVYTNGMKLVAADTSILPFGSLVSVPGYDESRVVPVLDRGGKIKGNRLDVLFPTHEAALQWGVQKLDVIVWEYVDDDGEASGES